MQTTYLSLGSNLGDRFGYLKAASSCLEQQVGTIEAASMYYETAAWGKRDQPDFLNQVLQLRTDLSAGDLLQTVLGIEAALGRERLEKWGARTVDIDILFYGQQCINEPGLVIPHPLLQDRRFILEPLKEIAPDLVHPIFNVRVADLLARLSDDLTVKPLQAKPGLS